MTSSEIEKRLRRLQSLLRKACHAPKCKGNERVCPNQCSCRFIRTFKMNNETAMCWVLADEIFHRLRYSRVSVTLELKGFAYGFTRASKYHMSEGWHTFFIAAYEALGLMKTEKADDSLYNYGLAVDRKLNYMQYVVNRLKREPR